MAHWRGSVTHFWGFAGRQLHFASTSGAEEGWRLVVQGCFLAAASLWPRDKAVAQQTRVSPSLRKSQLQRAPLSSFSISFSPPMSNVKLLIWRFEPSDLGLLGIQQQRRGRHTAAPLKGLITACGEASEESIMTGPSGCRRKPCRADAAARRPGTRPG